MHDEQQRGGKRRSKNGLWRDGRGTWHLDLSLKGAPRIRCSTDTTDKRAAEEYRDRVKGDLWRQVRLGDKPRVTWQQATEAWIDDASRRKIATVSDSQQKFDWLSEKAGWSALTLAEISKDRIKDALKLKYADGVSGSTVNRYYAAISGALHYAKGEGWIDGVPALSRKELYPENDGRFRWLTRDEADRLLAELPPHLRRMAEFSLATGLRQRNVCMLEWRDVDLSRRTAWAWPYQTKNNKRYSIPLNEAAMRVLRECEGQHQQYVFVYAGGRGYRGRQEVLHPISEPRNTAWFKAVARAQIADFTWHDMRHTWASWHVMNGTPLEVLQKLGGWSDFSMVLRYAHLSTSYIHTYAENAEIRVNISSRQQVAGSDVAAQAVDLSGRPPGTRTPNLRIKRIPRPDDS